MCFFHPFEDGNTRSAFLTLIFVLAREDVAPDVGLLHGFTFQSDHPQDALILARCVDLRFTETRRRAASPGP
ncbi:hypothetical protein [Streptomyces roseolilacinus]|uniref:hypothetical protein n=1 Tax=Streptomyces roseolilacinus TaxID=66904 RepID=UPI0037F449F2